MHARSKLSLTWRVSDDRVKELATPPWVTCDIERAQVENPLLHTVLTRGPEDSRGLLLASHLPTIDIRAIYKRAEVGCGLFPVARVGRPSKINSI